MPAVESSAISAIEYDEESRELSVTMVDGGNTYVYPDVPKSVYEAFLNAGSKGVFFNREFEPQYGLRR